jgi:hypothetical protein
MSVDLGAVRADIAAKITAAVGGLYPVTLDVRDVNPPCVVVGLPRVIGPATVCTAKVEVDVHVVAPPPGNADAVDWLLLAAADVYAAAHARTADPVTYPIGTQSLPAYRLVVAATATE